MKGKKEVEKGFRKRLQTRILSGLLALMMLMIIPMVPAKNAGVYAADTTDVTVTATAMYSYAYEVLDILNEQRTAAGLGKLTMDKELMEAAMQRAAENVVYVAATKEIAHVRPDGSEWGTVSDLTYGENLAAGQRTPESVMTSWTNSAGHYKNMMNSGYVSIGVGCVKIDGGYYYYWCQEFGYDTATTCTQPADTVKSYTVSCSSDILEGLQSNLSNYEDVITIGFRGWVKADGVWYYQVGSTYVTGWEKVNGKWYYFNEDGVMLTGWQRISGKWYYLNSSGAMQTGWKKISGKWYFFSGAGTMVTGWRKIKDRWYFFYSSGAMRTGWIKSSGNWYYMTESGAMAADEAVTVKGTIYYFNSDGICMNP